MKKIAFYDGWSFGHAGEEKRPVTLPHDAMLSGGRDASSPTGSAGAFFQAGVYEYEKTIDIPAEGGPATAILEFEGVMRGAKVYVNDVEAGGAAYGYIPFRVNLGAYVTPGGANVIRVVADNSAQPASRWYAGGGIYRPVWLWSGGKTVIAPDGVRVTTRSIDPPSAEVEVRTLGAQTAQDLTARVEIQICDAAPVCAEISIGADGRAKAVIDLPGAGLWSEETPNLYTCRVVLMDNGRIIDTAETLFGLRQVSWSSEGLFINGKDTLLRGGCVHHDNGLLGAASFDVSEYRRVKKLKEAGYNAIRSSHNPCSRAMLEACDALGVYLIDEGWDMWYNHKNPYDYAPDWRANHLADLKAMVDRDYNHPSVIMYSIGNEVSEPAKEEGVAAAKEMVEYLHGLDATRAVTGGFNLMIITQAKAGQGIYDDEKGGRKEDEAGGMPQIPDMNSTVFNMITNQVGTGMNHAADSKEADEATSPCLDLLDIAGYNYASGRYPMEGEAHPGRVLYGSETFPQDIAKNWTMVKEYPYLVGDFMWTAWDYLGEAGIGAWAYTEDGMVFDKPYPWIIADCGAFDILGNPGAPAAHAKAAWGRDERPWIGTQPVNHPGIVPSKAVWRGSNAIASWAWSGCDGNEAVIEVYSSAPSVEVFLNGESLGKADTAECKASFTAAYAPGALEAVAYDAEGAETGRSRLVSAKGELSVQLAAEKPETAFDDICSIENEEDIAGEIWDCRASDREIVYVNVAIADADGVVESNADAALTASVTGGELLAFGSANPRTEEDYLSGTFTTYYGRAQAIVRRAAGTKALLTVTGTAADGTEYRSNLNV